MAAAHAARRFYVSVLTSSPSPCAPVNSLIPQYHSPWNIHRIIQKLRLTQPPVPRQVGRHAGITSDNGHHDCIHFSHSAAALLCLPACRISLRVFPLRSFFLFLFLPVSPSLPTCFHSRCCLLFVQLPLPPIFSHFLSILSSQILYPPFHSSFIHLFILHHPFIHSFTQLTFQSINSLINQRLSLRTLHSIPLLIHSLTINNQI